MNMEFLQALLQILFSKQLQFDPNQQPPIRPGQSINEKLNTANPDSQQFANLLGGAGASFVQQPDSTFNYQPVDPRTIGQQPPPPDGLMAILDLLRKQGSTSAR